MKHLLLVSALFAFSTVMVGQRSAAKSKTSLDPTSAADRLTVENQRARADQASWTSGLDLRSVGPTVMSGRVADIAVTSEDGQEFYVAYASGGLWRTQNHGTTFEPLFDEALTITLGAVAVHSSGRIWAGTGEVNSSRSSYAGSGVYTSEDEGATWEHVGLAASHHIGRIVLDPTDQDIAYVAALGPLYSENYTGGVFKTTDAGKSWRRVLFAPGDNGDAGAVDLIMNPQNPSHLFAVLWDRTRRAWDFVGNGSGSGVWESLDGGENWSEVSDLAGFPKSNYTGRIGLAYHAQEDVLYALIDNQAPLNESTSESESSGDNYQPEDFKSMSSSSFLSLDTTRLQTYLDDNGFPEDATAERVLKDVATGALEPVDFYNYLTDGNKALFEADIVGAEVYRWNRADTSGWKRTHTDALEDVCYTYGYYFGLIKADPTDANHVYIAGVPLIQSTDGGANWESIGASNVHADHHYLWINPQNPLHLINGNDGGVNISWDGGENWVKCNSPEVGQFYAVEVDEAEPYNIYGGLQDNGTWRGPSRYRKSPGWHQSGHYAWTSIGGGDGMQIEVDPRDAQVVFSGSQFGWYSRQNLDSDGYVGIHPQHELGETPLRWNWQTPIWLSRHQPDILYMASNRLHRSLDQGQDWETLSEDLTRGGIPGNVPFGTITSLHESPIRFGQLAIGTDDGLIQISRDGGYTWQQLTSPVPQRAKELRTLWVSEVLWSAHHKDRLLVALNGYRLDHFESYVFMTENDGRTWKRLGDRNPSNGGSGLPAEPVNAIAESADWEQLLFVGTDGGCYASVDGGANWGTLHPELPAVPVHDLVIQERENELVIGTHGRSIWVADLGPWVDHAGQFPQRWQADSTLTLEWRDNWGEKGWAWSEPRAVEVSFSVYADQRQSGSWQWADSTGALVASLPPSTVHKGWQSMVVAAEWETENGVEFLEKGTYQLTWIGDDGSQLNGPVVTVEESEE